MKLAIVIPAFSGRHGWCEMAAENAAGWKPQCDDLIVAEDGTYCKELQEVADVYIMHPRYWTAENANIGWQMALARGADYVALMDSDVKYVSGSLRDACEPNCVCVPTIVQHPGTVSVAPMLVVPALVTKEMGMYHSLGSVTRDYEPGQHALYWFDNDFQARLRDKYPLVGVKTLKVSHDGGATTRLLVDEDVPERRKKNET